MKVRRNQSHNILISEAGEKVMNGEETWTYYPRPQLKRDNYKIINEGWTLNSSSIRLPFPPQSLLAQYEKNVSEGLVYRCDFPKYFKQGRRTILHFGAADQVTEVFINGKVLGKHEGGYLPFSFDITEYLHEENHLIVKVVDTLSEKYPYGKQKKKRGGMWYTPVSGIWQNVWMEQVPDTYIEKIKLTPDDHSLKLQVESTVVFGKIGVVEGEEKLKAFMYIVEKYSKAFMTEGRKYAEQSGHQALVYKIVPEKISGKARKK